MSNARLPSGLLFVSSSDGSLLSLSFSLLFLPSFILTPSSLSRSTFLFFPNLYYPASPAFSPSAPLPLSSLSSLFRAFQSLTLHPFVLTSSSWLLTIVLSFPLGRGGFEEMSSQRPRLIVRFLSSESRVTSCCSILIPPSDSATAARFPVLIGTLFCCHHRAAGEMSLEAALHLRALYFESTTRLSL